MRIFISHFNGDVEIAEKVKKVLTIVFGEGHDIFLSSELPAGDDWFKSIIDFLGNAEDLITVVITSKTSLERPWVWFEVGASWRNGAYVIPFCCKGFTSSSLPDPLIRLNGVNYDKEGFSKMINSIGKKIGIIPDKSVVNLAISKSM